MMRWIVESSLKFRHLVIAAAVLVMAVGVFQLRHMPVDVFPEFAPPFVEIQTEALGLSAEEVEALITVPLEADLLNGVSWLQSIHSDSLMGLSRIILIFEPGTELMAARQLVQERLIQAHALPNVSKPPTMLQPLSATSRVMMIGLSSEELSLIDMSVLARWNIRPRLMGVPGVANVSIWGQRKRQLQVQVDPERLRAEGVTLRDVIQTTGNALWVSPLSFLNASTPGTGGWIETPNQRLGIRHVLPISSPGELAQVAFELSDRGPLRLGDVAEVVENHQPLIGDALIDGGPGLLLVVEKFPGENTLEVTRRLDAAIGALRSGLSGIQIDTQIFRPADYIETSLQHLGWAFLIGAGLVALVLFVFHGQWRVALISLVSIPLSLAAAGAVLYLSGATLNVMVLAGLIVALGVVIDDAIVDVARAKRRLRRRAGESEGTSTASILLETALEVRRPLGYATVIVLLSVTPIFFLEGVAGAFFHPFALAYVLAVLAAMLVALTVTPALSLILLNQARLEPTSPVLRWIQDGYERVLSRTVQTPVPAYVTTAIIVLAGLIVLPFLGRELLPTFKEPDLVVRWNAPTGTAHSEAARLTAEAGRELSALPGVRNVTIQLGRAVLGDDAVDVDAGQMWINIDPAADYHAIVAGIQSTLDGYPGLFAEVQPYLKERIREVLSGSSDAIVVRVYGYDLDVLRDKAEEVRQALANIDGIADLYMESQIEEPQVQIRVDLAAAERHGLKPGDVRRAATTLLSGIEVGNLFEEQKVFDVVVWGVPGIRDSLTSVRELLIDTPGGGHVRLAEVADVQITPTLSVIKREGVSRRIDVAANVRGRDLGAVTRDVDRALQEVDFPLEYHAELLGEYAELQSAQRGLWGFMIAAAVGIFLLFQAAFGSWRLATLVFVTLPVGLAGGVLAAFVAGGTLSLGSVLGLFAVLGISVRNGILTITDYRRLEQHEADSDGAALVQRGSRNRVGPILMTALATGLALVPMVVAGNIAGLEILNPMAVVILGGLITATVLSLLILPALYVRFGSGAKPNLSGRKQDAVS